MLYLELVRVFLYMDAYAFVDENDGFSGPSEFYFNGQQKSRDLK
jgi:hypothetical protein